MSNNYTLTLPVNSGSDTQCWHFYYTNYKGEAGLRNAVPLFIHYGSTPWHPEPGWLLETYDVDKNGVIRVFAMKDMQQVSYRELVDVTNGQQTAVIHPKASAGLDEKSIRYTAEVALTQYVSHIDKKDVKSANDSLLCYHRIMCMIEPQRLLDTSFDEVDAFIAKLKSNPQP